MAERVYPASRPTPNGTTAAAANGGGANPSFPATKAQLYNATRPVYRPQAPPRRHKRSCCCRCCLWTTSVVIILVILAAIAAAVFYVLYRPERPTFAVDSLRLSQFNLTSAGALTSRFDLAVSARNPNKKITYFYDASTISVFSDGISVGTGSFPAFKHGTKNTTNLKTTIATSKQTLAAGDVKKLRSKKSLPLTINLDTKVKVKVGSLKTKKVGIKVTCDGIRVNVPAGKSPSKATTSDVNCKVDLRIKIWKWTL